MTLLEPPTSAMHAGWLAGKVGLAIGGAAGIGRGAVEACLAEGAQMSVLDRDHAATDALREDHPEILGTVGDATDEHVVQSAIDSTIDRWGRLDTLLVFVGVFDWYQPLADMTREQLSASFDELFAVNVKAPLLVVHAAIPHLRSSRGNVILTLSTSSFYPGRGGALYVASKFALRGLVLQLGHELAPEVRVNGVAPGGTIETNLSGLDALGTGDRRLGDLPDRADDLISRTPLGVALAPRDHAGAYVLLASDKARGLTGVTINSDGGIGVRG